MRFHDRRDAGRQLADRLSTLELEEPFVLGLPRGGVPVAAEVAQVLGAPLEVFVARKIGAPHHPEFGIGAVAEGGARVIDGVTVRRLGLTDAELDALARDEQEELQRRIELYRGDRSLPDLRRHTVVLVDDGLATGVTAEAALIALRHLRPGRLVLAIPVCAADTADRLRGLADEVVCAHQPEHFYAVGQWYEDFSQTTDDEVARCLAPAR